MKRGLFLIIFCFAARAGNEGGHAGDIYSKEYYNLSVEIGRELILLERQDPSLFVKWNFTATQFLEKVSSGEVRIVSSEGRPETEDFILDGEEVDEINFENPPKIKVNRTRWRGANLLGRLVLAMHGPFGVMKVEQDHYKATSDFNHFLIQVARKISDKSSGMQFMANLFYGRTKHESALGDLEICGLNEKIFEKSRVAIEEAKARCKIAERKTCEIVTTTYTPVVSTTRPGYRYCEILVVMK